MPFESNTLERIQEITPGAAPFKVILGDFVTTEEEMDKVIDEVLEEEEKGDLPF